MGTGAWSFLFAEKGQDSVRYKHLARAVGIEKTSKRNEGVYGTANSSSRCVANDSHSSEIASEISWVEGCVAERKGERPL